MFKGGLSSCGTIADNRNLRKVVSVPVRNFFDVSGNSLRIACSAGNLWPRMEVSMKGAESGEVLVLNPIVAA